MESETRECWVKGRRSVFCFRCARRASRGGAQNGCVGGMDGPDLQVGTRRDEGGRREAMFGSKERFRPST